MRRVAPKDEEGEQLAGLTATLTCADACHTLREAPTDASIDGSSMTDAEPGALPGGWSVLSGWDEPPEVEEECQTNFYIDRPLPRLFVPKPNFCNSATMECCSSAHRFKTNHAIIRHI